MKIHIPFLLSLILLGNTGILSGQSKPYEIGIEGGPGPSIIYSGSGVYQDSRFSIGGLMNVYFQYHINKTFALKYGMGYERKGTRVESNSYQLSPGGMLVYKLDYLDVPILVKVYAGRNIKFFVNAGPCFSFLLNPSLFYKPPDEGAYKLANEMNCYNAIDIGLIVGIGLSIPIEKKFLLSFELRNNLGFVNIRKRLSDYEFGNHDIADTFKGYTNSTVFVFGFGYRFGKGD
jgi:hypothetical protein